DFFGGARAALMTPATCGTFQTTSALTPWSDPNRSTPPNTRDGFAIGSGANGMGCVSSVAQSPFNPVFSAGTESAQAGAFSPFVLSFSRNDGEQRSRTLMETMPRGLLAKLAGVPLCSASDANAGDCPAGSQIGTVMVGAGAGPDLVFVTGRIFLTGPYGGGPFGEVVVVPAVAGPFNLGTVVVRGSIRIDPNTAQAPVVSDPFPTILDGIPIDMRRTDVVLDRPGLTFNPTNCVQQQVTGTIGSTQGASVAVARPFAASGCASLPFKPVFTA